MKTQKTRQNGARAIAGWLTIVCCVVAIGCVRPPVAGEQDTTQTESDFTGVTADVTTADTGALDMAGPDLLDGSPDSEGPAPTVSYRNEIYPILETQCLDCHKNGNGKLTLSGLPREDWEWIHDKELVVPGKPEESLLLHKGNGEGHFGGDLLDDDASQLVALWITQGAVDDGPSSGQDADDGQDQQLEVEDPIDVVTQDQENAPDTEVTDASQDVGNAPDTEVSEVLETVSPDVPPVEPKENGSVCQSNAGCKSGHCNDEKICSECTADAHCAGPTKTHCLTNSALVVYYICVECASNDNCPESKPTCLDQSWGEAAWTCAECTSKDESACTDTYCDTAALTCLPPQANNKPCKTGKGCTSGFCCKGSCKYCCTDGDCDVNNDPGKYYCSSLTNGGTCHKRMGDGPECYRNYQCLSNSCIDDPDEYYSGICE